MNNIIKYVFNYSNVHITGDQSSRPYRYAAFLSYSHRADATLSSRIQHAMEWFARAFHRGRAFRVFRDETNLSAHPDLWGSIEEALRHSEYYIYLASPT